jgi:hypothetical protein
MTDRDMPKFLKLCALLSQAFERPMDEALSKIYFEGLKDFSVDQVSAAVNQAVRTKTFLPKVAELRQLVEGAAEDRASQAWAAFLDAAADGGQASIYFADRAAAAAMDAVFGGWVQACRLLSAGWVTDRGANEGGCSDEMLAHYQKSFLRQYVAALNSKRDVECYRPGLSEMSMRERGASWSARIPTLAQPVIFVGQGKATALRLPFDVARGQLTEDARKAIGGGWDAVKALAAPYNPTLPGYETKALPPAGAEMATPEEVAELKAAIAILSGVANERHAPPEDQGVEASHG